MPFAFLSAACRQDMHDNPRFEANEDGANRQLPDGTVARGSLDLNPSAPKITQVTSTTPGTGGAAGASAPAAITGEDGFPFKLSDNAAERKAQLTAILDRGESRFNISCLPCHGKLGDGNGMIVQRGFRHPPSYHDPRLKAAPSSHFYDVMTNGFGAMPSYAEVVTPEDRWKIIAYIRVLQASQNVNFNQLS
ncbi:MAG: c-type cytochrome, partial [Blastocatellia bacterium]